EVARERLADLGLRRVRVLLEQGEDGDHEARRAEPALEGVPLAERLLQRVEVVGGAETLDGQDLAPAGLHCEHEAGPDGGAVDQDGARTAGAGLAPEVRPGDPPSVPQEVGQRRARVGVGPTLRAVDHQLDRLGHETPPARVTAVASARRATTPARWRRN